jgi:uncharacterized protein YqjF (DUF2071 family)
MLAVLLARAAFALPYEFADMRATVSDGEIDYRSYRLGSESSLHYRYRPAEKLGEARLGSLSFFLIERYRLFARRGNKLFTGQVHHSPYQLHKVAVVEANPGLFAMNGFETPAERPAHMVYSDRVDVSIYPPALCKV